MSKQLYFAIFCSFLDIHKFCTFTLVVDKILTNYLMIENGDPFSAHCISKHRISDQKVITVMVRAIVRVRFRVRVWVRVRVRLGDAVVRNAVGRKVRNHRKHFAFPYS